MAKDAILVDGNLPETQQLLEAVRHLQAARSILDTFALELEHWQDGVDFDFVASRFGATELDGTTPANGEAIYNTLRDSDADLRTGNLLALTSRVVINGG